MPPPSILPTPLPYPGVPSPCHPGQSLGREESASSLPQRGSQSIPQEGNEEAPKRCHLRGLMGGVGVGHVDGGRWIGWPSGQREELIPAGSSSSQPSHGPKGKGSLASELLKVVRGMRAPNQAREGLALQPGALGTVFAELLGNCPGPHLPKTLNRRKYRHRGPPQSRGCRCGVHEWAPGVPNPPCEQNPVCLHVGARNSGAKYVAFVGCSWRSPLLQNIRPGRSSRSH